MAEIVELTLVQAGEKYRLDADKILDAAKNEKFERMVIMGRLEDGVLYVAGTANAGESLVLIEHTKHFLLFGKDAAT